MSHPNSIFPIRPNPLAVTHESMNIFKQLVKFFLARFTPYKELKSDSPDVVFGNVLHGMEREWASNDKKVWEPFSGSNAND